MAGHASPLKIIAARFVTKRMAQSSSFPGAINTITLTLATNVPLLEECHSVITISNLATIDGNLVLKTMPGSEAYRYACVCLAITRVLSCLVYELTVIDGANFHHESCPDIVEYVGPCFRPSFGLHVGIQEMFLYDLISMHTVVYIHTIDTSHGDYAGADA